MQNLLSELTNVSKQKIILEPDVIIAGKLLDFEKFLPEPTKITDEIFEKIESVLIKCLYANKAQISFQCSIRIAECLLQLYQGGRQMKIWNLITAFNKKPMDPITYTTGFVLSKIGKYSKSLVSGVAKTIFLMNEKHLFAQLFALCGCFKASPRDMDASVEKCYLLIKKAMFVNDEPVQLLSLKLCVKLVKNGQLTAEKIIPLLTQLLQDQVMPYIIDQSCYLIAKLAQSQFKFSPAPIEKDPQENPDFKYKNKKISPQMFCAFNMMENFKQFFPDILPRFLALLDTEFINANRSDIFALIRRTDVSQLHHLISLLGVDVRREFFNQVSQEEISHEQISIMLMLSFDSHSLTETATLAYQYSMTNAALKDRTKPAAFFSQVVNKDPETASMFLVKATKFLVKCAKNIESSQEIESVGGKGADETLANQMKGISIIVASILSVAPNRKQLIELAEDNIVEFLKISWGCDSITSPTFQPSFTILTALPKIYVKKDEVDRLLSLYPRYLLENSPVQINTNANMTSIAAGNTSGITPPVVMGVGLTAPAPSHSHQTSSNIVPSNSNSSFGSNEMKTALSMAETLTLFLSVHPDFESTIPIIDCIFQRDYLRNHFTNLCIYLIFPKLKNVDHSELSKIAQKLRPTILRAKPSQDFSASIVKSPFITRTMFLKNVEFSVPKLRHFFTSGGSIETMYRVYYTFPSFILALPDKSQSSWIKWLVVENASSPTAHFLIYSLLKDQMTQKLLPANLHEVIIAVISSMERTDHLQIAAEIIACWAHLFPKIIPKIFDLISNKNDRSKCFVLAALYSNVQLNDNQISNQILELNNLIKTEKNLTPYALYALSSLFIAYPAQLAAMPFTDSQANFILSILCTNRSLDPFVLFYLARAFNALLPILSPDIENIRPFAIPVLQMITQLISDTPLPFCKQIFFHTMHTVFSFFRNYADAVRMEFPASKGATLSCKIEACQAFADMLTVKNLDHDFFELIPQCLLLLQQTEHNNPMMFIIAVAANFATSCDPTSPSSREQIQQWTQLIKLCVSAGNLPGTGIVKIAASDTVKLCMIKVAHEIVPLLLHTNPLLNEALDDIMTSLTRAVESRNPKLQAKAYPLIQRIVLDFGEIRSESGQPIIMLYDIMFASAVKIGFFNLDISGDFVLSFLEFHLKNAMNSPNSNHNEELLSVIDYFISGFKECNHKTWHFHAAAAKLVMLSIQNKEVYKKIESFLPKFAKDFSAIIFKAARLWSEDPPNDLEISKFKVSFSPFYFELLESFIFIISKLNIDIVTPAQLLAFLFDEIENENPKKRKESRKRNRRNNDDLVGDDLEWRIKAGFNALGALLAYNSSYNSSSPLTNKQIIHSIKAVKVCYDNWEEVIKPYLSKFLRPASELIHSSNKESWKTLVTLVADEGNFDPLVFCYLIKNSDSELISTYSMNFVDIIIFENYKEGRCPLDKAISLCTMLFYVADDKIGELFDFILNIKIPKKKSQNQRKLINEFRFSYISQILKFVDYNSRKVRKNYSERLNRLIWNNFDEEQCQSIAVQIVSEFPNAVKGFVYNEESDDYSNNALDSEISITNYLNFSRFLIENDVSSLQNYDDYINSVIRFCMRVAIQWSEETHGRKVIFEAIQLIKLISQNSQPLIRLVFKEMDIEFQRTFVLSVAQFVKQNRPNTKGANLQLFAKGQNKTKRQAHRDLNDSDDDDEEGEWQDLTADN